MRNPMFVYDEQFPTLILDYCRWRLALDPVPLDFGGQADPRRSLRGSMNAGGNDPPAVMESSTTSWPRPWSPVTAPGSCPSSRPPRPRRRCCSTWWWPARRSRAPPGSRPPGRSRPRIRPSGCWPTWPGCRPGRAGASCPAVGPAIFRPWWWPGTPLPIGMGDRAPERPVSPSARRPTRRSARPCGCSAWKPCSSPARTTV